MDYSKNDNNLYKKVVVQSRLDEEGNQKSVIVNFLKKKVPPCLGYDTFLGMQGFPYGPVAMPRSS